MIRFAEDHLIVFILLFLAGVTAISVVAHYIGALVGRWYSERND